MTQVKLYPKIALDLFSEQFKWSLWFYGFLIAAYIIGLVIVNNVGETLGGFFVFSTQSTSIFMLVCGILMAYGFTDYFVQQGISRKQLYYGTIIGNLALALAVTLIPLALNGLQHLIGTFIAMPVETDLTMLFAPATGWLSASGVYFLNIFTYYLIGWFIGIGYYRFGWLIGFVFVAIAIGAFSLNGYLWGDGGLSAAIPWIPHNPADSIPLIAVSGSLVMIVVLLAAMRLLTKRMDIKM